MPRLKQLLATTLLLLPLSLSGCMGTVGYSPLPYVHISTPYHFPRFGNHRRASLPSGNGGHYKTGSPYTVAGHTYYPLASARGYDETGIASWYGPKFHGQKTADGEYFDMNALSAAHRTLPLPTLVRVTNLDNGRQVIVRVNDRGPFVKGRLIDMSYAAARELGYVKQGTARVRVQALPSGGDNTPMVASRRRVTPPTPAPTPAPVTHAVRTDFSRPSHGIGLYVQLGAFASRANAEQLETSLKTSYSNIQVDTIQRDMQTLYRVRIGPYSDVQDIERIVVALKNTGHNNTVVTIE